jgi:hypothetical protein
MRGSDLSPQTPGRWPKSAALSGDDEESRNHQHNVRDEGRRKWLALHLLDIGKDALLVLVFVFHLSNFGRDTFELGIELVDNRLLLRIGASDVDGLRGKVAARAFILFLSVSMRRVACRTGQSTQSDRLRSHSYVKEHSSDVAEDKMRWGISGRLARSNEREPNQLRAHRSSHDRTEKAK